MTHLLRRIVIGMLSALPITAIAESDIKDSGFNPITTGVNTLTIAPDARGSSLGDIGVATSPDINSQFWNPSKYAFAASRGGVSANYTPWLKNIVDDMFLAYVSGYFKPATDNRQALSASFRYFSMGEVTAIGSSNTNSTFNPYELSFDIGYSRKLSNAYSMGIVLRYIYSDLGFTEDFNQSGGASAFSADISGYWTSFPIVKGNECQLSAGWNISNIGTKISYNDGADSRFLPTNLRVGTTFVYPVADRHNLSLSVDLNKLLVPAKPREEDYATGNEYLSAVKKWENTSAISGIFKSFSDAPGGFKEELKEICWSVGAEYSFDKRFFFRTGYCHESAYKGSRQYIGLGTGFMVKSVGVDVSYMVATTRNCPLDKTLRFTVNLDIAGLRELFK